MTGRFSPEQITEMFQQFTPQQIQRNLERLAKRYQPFSFQYSINGTGLPKINVGRTEFDTPAEAIEYIKRLGITNVDTFDVSQPRYLRPGSGGQSYLRLDQLSKELSGQGITIDRIGIQNSKDVLEQVQREFGGANPKAFMFSRGETTTGLIFYKDGRQLSRSEIMQVFKNIGFHLGDDAKTIKRLSALTNIYQYGGAQLDINALYYDPMQTQRAVDFMSKAGYTPVNQGKSLSYKVATGRSVGEVQGPVEFGSMDDIYDYIANVQNPLKKLSDKRSAEIIKSHNLLTGRNVSQLNQMRPEEIVEAGRYIEAQTAVKRAVDGSIYGSKNMVREITNYMRSEADAIEKSLQEASKLNPDAALTKEFIRAQKHVAKIRKNILELESKSIHGGVMNVRVMGASTGKAEGFLGDTFTDGILRSMGIDPESSFAKIFMGQGKGNIEIIGERGNSLTNWKSKILDMMNGYGGQVEARIDPKDGIEKLYNRATRKFLNPEELHIIAPNVSITTEFGILNNTPASRMGASISLARHGESQRVFADSQALYSDPKLFDPDSMRMATLRDVRKKIDYIKNDEILEEFARYEESKAAGLSPKANGILKSLIDVAENGYGEEKQAAEQMLEMLRAGIGPSENPMFAKLFTSSLKEFSSGKEGIPHLLMPLVQQAEIGNTLASSSTVSEGYISFQKGKGFLLNDSDYYLYHKAFGGFDLDDMLRTHLAWDRGGDSVIAITKRTPGALGEVGVFKVDMNDQLIDEMLLGRSEYADDVGKAVKQHMDDIALTEAKIKVKKSLIGQKISEPLSGEEINLITSKIENKSSQLMSMAIGANNEEELRFLDSLGIPESLGELEAKLSELRGASRREILLGGIEGRAKGVFEEASRIFETAEIEKNFTSKSLALTDEALGNIARYTSLSEEGMRWGRNLIGSETATLADFLDFSIEGAKNSEGILGLYSNSRMVIDSIISNARMSGEGDKLNRLLSDDKILRLLPQEDVIDALTKEGGQNADMIAQLTDENIGKLADILYENDLKIDRALIHNEFGRGKLHQQWVARISEKLAKRGASLENYLVDGYYSEFMSSSRYTVDLINQEHRGLTRSLGLTKELKNHLFELDVEKEADQLFDIANTVYKTHNPVVENLLGTVQTFGEAESEDRFYARSQKLLEARKEFFRELLDRGHIQEVDESFRVTEQGRNVIGALMQRRGLADLAELRELTDIKGERLARPSLFGGELEDIFNTTLAWFQRSNNQKAVGLAEAPIGEKASNFIRNVVQPSSRTEKVASEISRIAPDFGRTAYGRARAARNVSEDVLGLVRGVSESPYKRIDMTAIKEVFEHPTMKKGAIALGGLLVFSAIYQKYKHRDRSPEDMAGPPMLPGGSFYENNRGQYAGISENSQQSRPNGVTYRVRAIGDFNPEKFSNSLENATGASVNSSTYQSKGFRRKQNAIEEAISHSFR